MFKSPRFFYLENLDSSSDFDAILKPFSHKSPSTNQDQTYGFVSPFYEGELLTHEIKPHVKFLFAIETKIIHKSLVDKEVRARVEKIRSTENREINPKEIKNIRETVRIELRRTALTKIGYTQVLVNRDTGLLVIDSTSNGIFEKLKTVLLKALPGLSISPLAVNTNPSLILTQWLSDTPPNVRLGTDCVLLADDESKSRIACTKLDDIDDEVEGHVDRGKVVSALAIGWNDDYVMTLKSDLSVNKFRSTNTDAGVAKTDEELDTQMAMFAPVFDQLSCQLQEWFA